MKKRNTMVRIIALVMVAIMVIGVAIIGLSTLLGGNSADAAELVETAVSTGSDDGKYIVFIAAGAVALVAAIVCIVTKKKKQ